MNDSNNINNNIDNNVNTNVNTTEEVASNTPDINDIGSTPLVGRRTNPDVANLDNNEIEPKNKVSIFTIIVRIILVAIIFILLFILLTKDGKQIIYRNFVNKIEISKFDPNKYYRARDYEYVQITNDFEAKDKQHLLNIYYTIVNSGANEFTFACSNSYKDCIDDVQEISNSEIILSNIKAFVHPFNGFTSIGTQYSTHGEVVLTIYKSYTSEEIKAVEKKMNQVIQELGIDLKDNTEIIKTYHDYIINNTKYDSVRSEENIENYKSDIAYGPLIQGFALCGGYSEAMALFLDHYNIPNFRINSKTHIWNAVYLDGKWVHLDLTWDDPITTSGKDVLRNTYFLITTDELLTLEKSEHNFDKSVFSEFGDII